MNHSILKEIIYDNHRIIRNFSIVERDYELNEEANYVLVGLRRAGKSTMLYKKALQLIDAGADWEQIIYINFEDERISDFTLNDFNDIVQTAGELTTKKPYYFLDEIQIVDGWELFARRLADSKERVFITGSNAKMLSNEIEAKLGGRFLSKRIMTYSFEEYLDARTISHDEASIYTSALNGQLRNAAREYMYEGGFPEAISFRDKRTYIENVYNKVLLGDIAARNGIRNIQALRIMMKKIAETITSEISYTKLTNIVNSIGIKLSKDSLINYIGYTEDAYLLFRVHNYIAKFSDKESTPRFYYYDNGLLNLFLINKDSLLLENTVATHLKRNFNDDVYYFKSTQTGIDVDFYLPTNACAIQVTYTLNSLDYEREIKSLVALANDSKIETSRLMIVTLEDDEHTIQEGDVEIEVVPLYKFLLEFK